MTSETNYDDKLKSYYTGDHWVKPDTSRTNGIYNGHYIHSRHIHDWVEQHNFTLAWKGEGQGIINTIEIWHKPATTNWVAQGEPREYEPAMYIVVQKTDEVIGAYTRYDTLQVAWATKKSKKTLKALIAEYTGETKTEASTETAAALGEVDMPTMSDKAKTAAALEFARGYLATIKADAVYSDDSTESYYSIAEIERMIWGLDIKMQAIIDNEAWDAEHKE